MTNIPYSQNLWEATSGHEITNRDAEVLRERAGLNMTFLNDPAEHIIGFRVLDLADVEAPLFYVTRRLDERRKRAAGAHFFLRTMIPEHRADAWTAEIAEVEAAIKAIDPEFVRNTPEEP